MADIFREPTTEERRDFTEINVRPGGKIVTARQKFDISMGKQREKCLKEKKPFFKKAVMDDFDAYYKETARKSLRIHGYVDPADFKPIKIDWDKYSSPDNIEFVEVVDVRDAYLSKKNPFDVHLRTFRYRYRGYGEENSYNISVQEEPQFSVKRSKSNFEGKDYKEEANNLAYVNSALYGNKEVDIKKK